MMTSMMQRVWPSAKELEVLPKTSLEVYLQERPKAGLTSSTFATRSVDVPEATSLSASQSLVRVLYVSVDPAMRGWLDVRKSYIAPVAVGAAMRAIGLGRVVRAADATHVGRMVVGSLGWRQFAVMDNAALAAAHYVPRGVPVTTALGVLGTTGMTAFFGLTQVGRMRSGDVVVVSAAAGATGSVAAQIAKLSGCAVIGIAGGSRKCRYLREELGICAVDYKAERGVAAELQDALDGRSIDVYFDNVGGAVLEAALRHLARGARIVLCGGISAYNSERLPSGPRNYLALIAARASMTGFLVYDFEKDFGAAYRQLGKWLVSGELKVMEEVVEGVENAPAALQSLFDGGNLGKVIVRVAPDDGHDDLTANGGARAKL